MSARSLFAALVLLPLVARSEAPLTLAEVAQSLKSRYPPWLAAVREAEAAEADLLSAQGAFDPTLRARGAYVPGFANYPQTRLDASLEVPIAPLFGASVVGGYRLGSGKFPAYYGDRLTNEGGEVRLGASVPLLRNGPTDRRRANIGRAKFGVDAADLAARQALVDAGRAAALRYWEWVAAGQRLQLATQLHAVARARERQIDARAASGDLPAIDRTDNLRAVEQRAGQVAAAERALAAAAFELSLFVRDEAGNPVFPPPARLPAGFPEVSEVAVDRALEQARERPDVRRLRALREQALVELAWAENQLLPGLDLSIAGAQDLGTNPDPSTKRGAFDLELGGALELPVPMRVARGRIDAARAAADRFALLERFAGDRAATDVRDAASALELAKTRLDAARRELALARALEDAERTRFELGDSTLLFVNLREQQSFETAGRIVDALADWHRARAQLDAAAARLPGLDEA
jgi:outer membrane protein TolC